MATQIRNLVSGDFSHASGKYTPTRIYTEIKDLKSHKSMEKNDLILWESQCGSIALLDCSDQAMSDEDLT